MSSHSLDKKGLTHRSTTEGFTLVELMVSVGIMLFITSVVLLNQGQYTSNISLTNLANDISLTIRQAQIYGVSVKELTTGSGDFSSAYGVDFNIGATGSNNAYIFFADRGVSKDGFYDDLWSCPIGGSSECLQKITLTSGNTISQLCMIRASDGGKCSGNISQIVDRADITFQRPSNAANMVFFNGGSEIPADPSIRGVQITVTSASPGLTHSVIVYTTGQISVK